MAVLDVWIAQPGNVSRMDDHAWTVTIFDAQTNVFVWAGVKYADLPAPEAHWAGKVPPGTYVIQALSVPPGRSTDHAIAAVDCADTACVHLYVADARPPRPGKCEITITDVRGEGGVDRLASIRVSGTAVNCKNVEVFLSCRMQKQEKTVVAVSATGDWLAIFSDVEAQKCKCGGPVSVVARCRKDPKCIARFETNELPCKPPQSRD